ncbi:hypothetical protein KIH41_04570 [Litoribacter ruber]|uniref:hypothetical protein n=1 Tax=Litoribacter ruber TaxID=702568 RepID=UPI001BDAC8D2|nr:hypothetical protein [Litoribacter ruber]MBT0810547.1 hypothetical protein [Litoribacter ruber]
MVNFEERLKLKSGKNVNFVKDKNIMDIQTEKLRLIEWLAGLNDPKILEEFINLKNKKDVDWWEQISAEERSEIEQGLQQADKGDVNPHSEVMEKYKKWL